LGSKAFPTNRASGTMIFSLENYAARDNNAMRVSTAIYSYQDGVAGVSTAPGRMEFHTAPGNNNALPRMSIMSDGNVLIGQTNNVSGRRLQVTGDSTLTGNVGIGTNTPTQRLHVNGSVLIETNLVGQGGYITNFLQAGTYTTNTPTAGQIAKYNATDGRWYAADDSTGSGISADTATNIARDAWSLAYVVEPAYGTATVARTFSDTYYREFSTYCTNATELNIDVSTFPTNGGAVFGWVVNPMGNTMTVNSDAIDTNSWADVELTTNAYNRLIFDKAPYETKFYVTGR
jgi:hypothetical protein